MRSAQTQTLSLVAILSDSHRAPSPSRSILLPRRRRNASSSFSSSLTPLATNSGCIVSLGWPSARFSASHLVALSAILLCLLFNLPFNLVLWVRLSVPVLLPLLSHELCTILEPFVRKRSPVQCSDIGLNVLRIETVGWLWRLGLRD